jgi:hypothetical protein
VAELLCGDVGYEIVERSRSLPVAEIEGLERVVQERGLLAEATTNQLLHGRCTGGSGSEGGGSSAAIRSIRRIMFTSVSWKRSRTHGPFHQPEETSVAGLRAWASRSFAS